MGNYGRAESLRLSGKPYQALGLRAVPHRLSPRGLGAEAARNSIDVIIEMLEMSGRNRKYRIRKMQHPTGPVTQLQAPRSPMPKLLIGS